MYHKEQEDEAHVSDDSPLKSATMLFKVCKSIEKFANIWIFWICIYMYMYSLN